MSRLRLPAVAAALALVFAAAPTVPAPGQATGADDAVTDVPVLATFVVHQSRDSGSPLAAGAVHGVRRIEGATVLYYSLGFPKHAGPVSFFGLHRQPQVDDRWGPRAGWPTPYVVDAVGRMAYTALVREEDGDCVCSSHRSTEDEPGKVFVLYTALPELPADVTEVDVAIGFDTIVRGVPVRDGALTPPAGPGPVVLGDGWPSVDTEAVRTAPAKERSIYPLETRVSDLEERVTTVETPTTLSVELAADVLFAFDSATLTAEATQIVRAAAATINERAAPGEIAVIGHTDSSGADAYNDDLSARRANAVREALAPLVTLPGVSIRAEGRGEREPVEDNGSDAGRRRNRRVTVTFNPKDRP